MTLTPAYGRDYKSKAAVLSDFDEGRDFVEAMSGRYINKVQIEPGTSITFRYAKLRKVMVHRV